MYILLDIPKQLREVVYQVPKHYSKEVNSSEEEQLQGHIHFKAYVESLNPNSKKNG